MDYTFYTAPATVIVRSLNAVEPVIDVLYDNPYFTMFADFAFNILIWPRTFKFTKTLSVYELNKEISILSHCYGIYMLTL